MPTAEQDSAFVRAALGDLADYLSSNELYRTLEIGLPQLTLGALLLARCRIAARRPSQDPALQLEEIRSERRAAWMNKVRAEYGARLNLWRNYLQDYHNDPFANADAFAHDVAYRAMLTLLGGELPEGPPDSGALDALDADLRQSFLPDGFVWDADLAPLFPPADFWFLYGRLKT